MDFKRIFTIVVGIPIMAVALIFSNNIIFDIFIAVIAASMLYEYNKSFTNGKAKPIMWIGYVFCILTALMHIISAEIMKKILILSTPTLIVILFLHIIITKMEKYTIQDISVTLFGIVYTVVLISFVSLLRAEENGKILVWYIFWAAWGTDTLGYLIGRYFGKHFFSKISPKKTIEGCIARNYGSSNIYTNLYVTYK